MVLGVAWQGWWLGRPAAMLSVLLVICGLLWQYGGWVTTPRTAVAAALAIAVFAVHATEETLTGFAAALPALVGDPPWSTARFVTFNATWGAVFVAAALALRPGRRLPLLPLLFLAVAGGIGNGLAHLLAAVIRGGYVPGAWTALPCLLAGAWLLATMRPAREPLGA